MELKFDNSLCAGTRTIYLGGTVNAQMSREIIQAIHLLSQDKKRRPITILINSGGGSTDEGMAIYNALSHCPCPVVGKVVGICMSAAATILQACNLRLVSEQSTVMIHDGEAAVTRSGWHEAVETGKQLAREAEIFYNLMSKRTGLSTHTLRDLCRHSTYFTAKQTVQYGLADGILTIPPKKEIRCGKVVRRARRAAHRKS